MALIKLLAEFGDRLRSPRSQALGEGIFQLRGRLRKEKSPKRCQAAAQYKDNMMMPGRSAELPHSANDFWEVVSISLLFSTAVWVCLKIVTKLVQI